MLEARHIVRLKLDQAHFDTHMAMPKPAYVSKPLIGQFSALNDAILTALLSIPTEQFRLQLEAARRSGTEYVCEDGNSKSVGVSVSTSLVKSGDIMKKHLVVPRDFLQFDRRLTDNIMVGAFIHGNTDNGSLSYDGQVEIAGWITAANIQKLHVNHQPPMFQSKLNVVMVPCTALQPIETLITRLGSGNATV